ncbi:hypothetical protein EMGR_002788 [Emarellia grisea]
MAQFHPTITPEALKDKVIVVTGGANGIGASLVEYCGQQGAYVCFGDVAENAGYQIAQSMCSSGSSSSPRAVFQHTDVTSYQSVLGLFDLALKTYGRIDHVVACAGIMEIGNLFDPALTLETVRETPTTKVLDVNLTGCLYVARIASVYLRQNRPENADRSITLISSVAGFKESPGMFVYQASKHGVLGLMRSLRLYLSSPTHHIRVNAICPWMTTTAMVKGVQEAWMKAKLPCNTPADVAYIIAGVLADSALNGKSIVVGWPWGSSSPGVASGAFIVKRRRLIYRLIILYGSFASAYISRFPASLIELFGVQYLTSVNGVLVPHSGDGSVDRDAVDWNADSSVTALVSSIVYDRVGIVCGVLLFAATLACVSVRIDATLGEVGRWKA